MLFKLSNMNSNLALTLCYLNRALNNSAQESLDSGLQEQKILGFRNPDFFTLGGLTSIEPVRSHLRSVRQL